MKWYSKYVFSFLLGAFVFTGGAQGLTDQLKYLSINEAVELALNENLKVKQAELAEERADISSGGAALLRDLAMSKYHSEADPVRKAVYASDYYSAEKNYRLANTNDDLKREAVTHERKKAEISAKQKYLDVLKAKAMVDVATNKLSVAHEQLKQTNLRYKVGMVSKKDVLDAEVQLASAEVYVKGMKSQYSIKHYSLRREIGVPLFQQIIPTTTFTYQPIEEIDIDKAAELYAKDSYEMQQLEQMLETYKELKDFGGDNDFENTPTYTDIDLAIDETEAKIKALKKDYALAVYGAYTRLKSSEDQIKILQKKIEAAKESLRIAKLQYKNGMATTLMVDATESQLVDIQTQYFNAIYDYNLMKLQFEEKMFLDMLGGAGAASSGDNSAQGGM